DGEELDIDATVPAAVVLAVIRVFRRQLAAAADVDFVDRHSLGDQVVANRAGTTLGQALVVGLRADVAGVTDQLHAADPLAAGDCRQHGVELALRLALHRRAVKSEIGVVAELDLVAHHDRRLRIARHLARHFHIAGRGGRAEVAATAKVIAPQQPGAGVVAVGLEQAALAIGFQLQAQTVRAVAELLVDAQRERGLVGIVVALLVVEAGAQTDQRLLEPATTAQADTPVIRLDVSPQDRRQQFDLLVGAAVALLAGDHANLLGPAVDADQTFVGDRPRQVQVPEAVLALHAEAEADLAVLERVLVDGEEGLGDPDLLRPRHRVLDAHAAPQPVVVQLDAAG